MARAQGKAKVDRSEYLEGYSQIVEHSIQQIDRAWMYYKYLFGGIGLLIVVGTTVFGILYAGNMRDMKAALVSEVNIVERQVRARIDQEFQTERIRRLLEDTASKEVQNAAIPLIKRDMNGLVVPEIRKAQKMASAVGDQIAELKASLAEAERKQTEFATQVATLALFYKVRQGSRQAYMQLADIVESGTDEEKTLCAPLLDEIGIYYEDLKRGLFQRRVVFRPTGARYRPHAERIYKGVLSRDLQRTTREAFINEIAQRKLRYFVEDLVKLVRDDPDLKVGARAAKAIGSLTGQDFDCVPPFSDTLHWWDTIGDASDVYRSPFLELERLDQLLKAGDRESALAGLIDTVKVRPGLADARFAIAKIYLRRDETGKAIEQLEAIDAECDAHNDSLLLYAILLVKEGEKAKACDILEKVKKFASDSEAFIRVVGGAKDFQPLADEDRFKRLISE